MNHHTYSAIALSFFFSLSAAQGSLFSFLKGKPSYDLQPGDIVFQDTGGAQGAAVQAATNSPYTHCGVIFKENRLLYVLEAIQPVCATRLDRWKSRSSVYHAMRLKDPSKLTPEVMEKARSWAKRQIQKPYDLKFQWDDSSLYCSELVWKLYERSAGIRLCEPKTFQSYFLQKPEVKRIIASRYGSMARLPKNEPVVAPSDLATSSLLEEVPRRLKK